MHSYSKLFYYYRASKYLSFYETEDEVNAVADEDTKHCGLALYPHSWYLYNNIVPSGFQKESAIRHLTMQILEISIVCLIPRNSQKLGIFLQE